MAADFPFVSIPWTRETLKLFFGVELSRLGHGSVLERNIDLLTGVSWASKGNLLAGTLKSFSLTLVEQKDVLRRLTGILSYVGGKRKAH